MSEVNQTETRPRPRSILSFESKRSRRSSNSGPKLDLTESSSDKKRLHTKADPSMAMTEAQPAAVALEESNLDNIRRMAWKDTQGNVIADPDRSNPTRARMERPLDTIRSFEAAVEGTYNSRRSTFSGRPASQANFNGTSRRNSSFAVNSGSGNNRSQYGGGYHQNGGGYYQSGRGHGQRPDSVAEDYEGRDPRYSYPPRVMRNGSSPMISGSNPENVYPSHGYQPSYDTITTGGGSYGTDTRGTSTDPSSQNSSVDRFPTKPEEYSGDNNQGIGYSNGPFSPVSPVYSSEQTYWKGANGRPQAPYGRNEYVNGHASNHQIQTPAVPQKQATQSAPIKLDTGTNAGSSPIPLKRQSWLKRRFSKKT